MSLAAEPTNSTNRMPALISVVVPMLNETGNLDAFFRRLTTVLDGLGLPFEVICINDGSSDDTLERLLERQRTEPRLTVIDLSRNFGKECALSAGLQESQGDVVVTIDSDLQHPPETIVEMLAKWRDGFEMVYAVRHQRVGQTFWHRQAAKLFYVIMRSLSDVSMPADAGDFRLLDRAVVDAINRLPERQRFMKGIFAWVGFRQTGVVYRQEARVAGASGWQLARLIRFAFDGLTAFSTFPLTIWMLFGAAISGLSFFYIVIRFIVVAINGVDVPGYESTIMIILFLGGIQLLGLGVLGSYLGRVFGEVKGRPLYIVRRVYSAGSPDGDTAAPAP